MGFEKLINFLSRNLSYNTIEELVLENSAKKVFANHVIFDINFVIYYCIVELEEEINDIIKIIYSLQFNYNNAIESKVEKFVNLDHWKKICKLEDIIDGNDEEDMLNKFKSFLNLKSVDNISNVDKILFWKIFFKLNNWIKNFHDIDFIKSLIIFFDGIPSYSKILEQRRRRCKNYFESKIRRKLFKENFDNMRNDIISEDGLVYNYFDWLNNKFSLNKSIGPSSHLILNLGLFLERRFKELYLNNFDTVINSGLENGEADNKIFKYIHKNNLLDDIVIHTCDSDLIHQILAQQVYFNLIQKNLSLSVIRYYTREFGGAQLIDGKKTIKYIIKKYNDLHKFKNYEKVNYKIILDLLILIYFFGNDNLPSHLEMSFEISLELMILSHIKVFGNNENIVYIKNNVIRLNILNLKKILCEFKNKNTVSIVILNKYYKLPYQLVNFLVNKLNLKVDNIIDDFFIPYYTYEGYRLINIENKELHYNDIRLIYYNKYLETNIDSIPESPLSLNLLPDTIKKKHNDMKGLIDKFIDFFDLENNGMPINNKIQMVDENPYQDLYKYISNKSINLSIIDNKNYYKPYPYNFNTDNIKENKYDEKIIDSYLKNIYYLVSINFNDMSNYNPCNFVHFDSITSPSFENIINFINNNDVNILYNKWDHEIKINTVDKKDYFDNLAHHLFITPYLKESEYFSKINDTRDLSSLIDKMYNKENIFWYRIKSDKNFNYRKIDCLKYIKLWKSNLKDFNLNNENKIILFNNDDKCI